MAIAVKRILLVTRNVQFAIDSKRALEALGAYAVTTVTEARNAVEQLRRKPHHLVLLDVENLAIAPAVMIDSIRARQGEIAIVLAPDIPKAHELARDYRAQGVVDIPAPTRSLIPVLESSLREIYEALPKTLKLPAVDVHEDTVEIEALVDDLLGDDALPSYTLHRLQASYRLLHPEVEGEPGAAALNAVELVIEPQDDGETISYRRVGSNLAKDGASEASTNAQDDDTPLTENHDESTVRDLGRALAKNPLDESDQFTTVPAVKPDDAGAMGTALKEALEQDSTLENLSMLTLYEKITGDAAADHPQKPHWMRESEKFVREPDFLKESMPVIQSQPTPEQTTAPAPLDIPAESATTEVADFRSGGDGGTTAAASRDSETQTPLRSFGADPVVTQLAATMTQVISNLTALATVLTRDNLMVAFSGNMPPQEFKALRTAISEDWTVQQNRARLRFVTVSQDSKDYMIYSKTTVNGLTLSLIFAGDKPLSAISGQGDLLLRALADVVGSDNGDSETKQDLDTKPPPDAAAVVPESQSSKLPFAFVWLTADPTVRFSEALANQLVFWLEVQLNGLGWTLRRLDVHQDFVHVLADVPATNSPEQLIRDLMERSLRIIRSEDSSMPEELWADAYLVMQPGRELDSSELRKFLQFARAQH